MSQACKPIQLYLVVAFVLSHTHFDQNVLILKTQIKQIHSSTFSCSYQSQFGANFWDKKTQSNLPHPPQAASTPPPTKNNAQLIGFEINSVTVAGLSDRKASLYCESGSFVFYPTEYHSYC